MALPQDTGGPIHKELSKRVNLNTSGTSTALFAGQPDEKDWIHAGEEFKGEPARQCSAQNAHRRTCNNCNTEFTSSSRECPNCGDVTYTPKRCTSCAEPTKATCWSHGASIVKTKEQIDLAKRGSITNGTSYAEIMLCPCLHAETCSYVGLLVDEERFGSIVPRCLPEQAFYDSTIEHFRNEYDLDPVADQVMLHRLVISLLRIMRGEKIIAQYGEIVERIKTSPDGTYETWYEQSAVAKTVESLDRRLQSWLKELAISKAAREGKKLTINGNIDITNVLSVPKGKIVSDDEDQIIDIDYEEQ